MTALMYLSLYGDVDNIIYLLDRLKQYYEEDVDAIYAYLNAREPKRGRTALIFATYNRNVRLFKTLIEKFDALLDRMPKFLYKLFITRDLKYGLSPLASSVYESATHNVYNLVEKAYKRFGKDKKAFDNFINIKNGIGLTPLALAISADIAQYLQKFGAKKYPATIKKVPQLDEAFNQGIELLHAIQAEDTEKVKNLLTSALRNFTEKSTFFGFISRRNGDGWNALMNASADGKLEYVQFIFNAMNKGLRNDRELIFDILNTVDISGETSLQLALLRRHYEVAQYILKKAYDVAGNRNNFFRFLNAPDELTGYTALIQAAFSSQEVDDDAFETIKLMIHLAQNYFGKSSRAFELFINAQDYNNFRALDYVQDEKIRQLLKENGARE